MFKWSCSLFVSTRAHGAVVKPDPINVKNKDEAKDSKKLCGGTDNPFTAEILHKFSGGQKVEIIQGFLNNHGGWSECAVACLDGASEGSPPKLDKVARHEDDKNAKDYDEKFPNRVFFYSAAKTSPDMSCPEHLENVVQGEEKKLESPWGNAKDGKPYAFFVTPWNIKMPEKLGEKDTCERAVLECKWMATSKNGAAKEDIDYFKGKGCEPTKEMVDLENSDATCKGSNRARKHVEWYIDCIMFEFNKPSRSRSLAGRRKNGRVSPMSLGGASVLARKTGKTKKLRKARNGGDFGNAFQNQPIGFNQAANAFQNQPIQQPQNSIAQNSIAQNVQANPQPQGGTGQNSLSSPTGQNSLSSPNGQNNQPEKAKGEPHTCVDDGQQTGNTLSKRRVTGSLSSHSRVLPFFLIFTA